MNPSPNEPCGKTIDGYPLPRCTLTAGHRGICKTTIVPEGLSELAADLLREHDAIDGERLALHAERATLLAALGSSIRQRRILAWSIVAHFTGAAVWLALSLIIAQRMGLL